MNTFTFRTLFIAFFCLVFASCRDKEETTIAPEPVAEQSLNREITYENNTKLTSGYLPTVVKATASSTTEEFIFYSGVDEPNGVDHISFKLTPDKLKAGFVGEYTLKSASVNSTGEAIVQFSHSTAPGSAALYGSGFSTFEGNFTITAFDAKTNRISGSYQVVLKAAHDPYAAGAERHNPRKCDIVLTGAFKNVKVN